MRFKEDHTVTGQENENRSQEELKALWKCNDKIAALNYDRTAHMLLTTQLTPAVPAYEGIAYQYMAPAVFENGQYDYVQEHLRILWAFYGVLKPMDGVTPYRLEMQATPSLTEITIDILRSHSVKSQMTSLS